MNDEQATHAPEKSGARAYYDVVENPQFRGDRIRGTAKGQALPTAADSEIELIAKA
jgi:hypothetical protein